MAQIPLVEHLVLNSSNYLNVSKLLGFLKDRIKKSRAAGIYKYRIYSIISHSTHKQIQYL